MTASMEMDEFVDLLDQMAYNSGSPLDRFFINRFRRRDGLPPLRFRPISSR
jgi:hypothetical protein